MKICHKLLDFITVLSSGPLGLGCVGVVDLRILVYLFRVCTAGQNALGSKHRHAINQVTDIIVGKEMLKMWSLTLLHLLSTVVLSPDTN